MKNLGFKLIKKEEFSLYYILTRVYSQSSSPISGYGAQIKKNNIHKSVDNISRSFYLDFVKENILLKKQYGPISGYLFKKIK